jgi:hypothetical protein
MTTSAAAVTGMLVQSACLEVCRADFRGQGRIVTQEMRAAGPDRMFLAPDHIGQLAAGFGWPRLEQQFEAALAEFIEASPWLRLVHRAEPEAIATGFRHLLGQASSPADVHLVIPGQAVIPHPE